MWAAEGEGYPKMSPVDVSAAELRDKLQNPLTPISEGCKSGSRARVSSCEHFFRGSSSAHGSALH